MKDTMNKDVEALQKKAKIIDAALRNAENELEAFQVCALSCAFFYFFSYETGLFKIMYT